MRIVGNRCRAFEYTPTAKGPCAVDLAAPAVGLWKHFFDCLLLNVTVAPGDRAVPEKAVRMVRRIATAANAGQFVVNGFVLLPESGEMPCAPDGFDVLCEIADALDVLTEFVERLEQRGEQVHLMPFGWKTTCHIDASGHQGRQWVLHLSADPVDTALTGLDGACTSAYSRSSRTLLSKTTTCTKSM